MSLLVKAVASAALVLACSAACAGNLWVTKDELAAAPAQAYDKKTRVAFIEKCRRQFGAQESTLPTWCPCAFDFVTRHNYYVEYLSFKAKGSEMDRALRPYVKNITRECGWVDNDGAVELSTPPSSRRKLQK